MWLTNNSNESREEEIIDTIVENIINNNIIEAVIQRTIGDKIIEENACNSLDYYLYFIQESVHETMEDICPTEEAPPQKKTLLIEYKPAIPNDIVIEVESLMSWILYDLENGK